MLQLARKQEQSGLPEKNPKVVMYQMMSEKR